MTTDDRSPEGLRTNVIQAITDYLCGGGLWNPELARHDVVRDLLMDARAALVRVEAPQATTQQLYDLTTWLLSEAPHGIVEKGARQEYHDALQAVTNFREELRCSGQVSHDESFWHRSRIKAALPSADSEK